MNGGSGGNKTGGDRPGMPGDFNESGNSSGQSYSTKGIKAESEINISGFTINIYSTDDGINACTGDGKTSPIINVTGGYIDVTTASGDTDGIDSNGNYVQTGGMVCFTVNGSFSNGWICSDTLTTGTSYTLYRGSDSIADWTQESGTMGASGSGGFGSGRR